MKSTDKPSKSGEETAKETQEQPATLFAYEVTVAEVKIGAVKAYRTAIVRLTKKRAADLLEAMPGSLRLLGLA